MKLIRELRAEIDRLKELLQAHGQVCIEKALDFCLLVSKKHDRAKKQLNSKNESGEKVLLYDV